MLKSKSTHETVPLQENANEQNQQDRAARELFPRSHTTRRLTLFLEVLERQNPEQHVPIISPLFGALDRLMAVESDTRTSLNYPKQMVLSCPISIVKQFWVFVYALLANATIRHQVNVFRNRFIDRMYQNLHESASA